MMSKDDSGDESTDSKSRISWKKPPDDWDGALDDWPAALALGYVVDEVVLGPTFWHGNTFPIWSYSIKAIRGGTPTLCPNADPQLREEFLQQVDDRFRELGLVGDEQTIHWVGEQRKIETVCCCDPEAIITPRRHFAIDALTTDGVAGGSTPPAAPGSDETPPENDPRLRPSARNAFASFNYASETIGSVPKDHEAHSWLKEHGMPDDNDRYANLADYTLPAVDTWSRQLRTARKALGEQKHTSRAGRGHGGSIVKSEKI